MAIFFVVAKKYCDLISAKNLLACIWSCQVIIGPILMDGKLVTLHQANPAKGLHAVRLAC